MNSATVNGFNLFYIKILYHDKLYFLYQHCTKNQNMYSWKVNQSRYFCFMCPRRNINDERIYENLFLINKLFSPPPYTAPVAHGVDIGLITPGGGG
jgi:hypothetical protein